MYVVGVGLKKVYKALIRLAGGHSLLMSVSAAFSVPWILQARILKWVAISLSGA